MYFVLCLALSGGLFAVMTFIHFFVDWIFQSHAEAMAKHNDARVRARHCLVYTLGFAPLLVFFLWTGALTFLQFFLSLAILFFSHFVEDTYLPIYYWALYIRKPPELTHPITYAGEDGAFITEVNPKIGFVQFVQTSLGKILMIAIDQIIHIAFLFPIVWMVVWNTIKALNGDLQ